MSEAQWREMYHQERADRARFQSKAEAALQELIPLREQLAVALSNARREANRVRSLADVGRAVIVALLEHVPAEERGKWPGEVFRAIEDLTDVVTQVGAR